MNKNLRILLSVLIVVMLGLMAYQWIQPFSGPPAIVETVTMDGEDLPEYNGQPYAIIDNNNPQFTEEQKESDTFEYYGDLDALGRCTWAFANLSGELMPTEQRESISHVHPTGWHHVEYPDLIQDDVLYNRCHLIAFKLAAENDNEKNLITGTRYLNNEGMTPFEDQVFEYMKSHPHDHVLYRVTPIFEGENLVASGVRMEGYSVEDDGKSICFDVYIFNVQPGITINYKDGTSYRSQPSENQEEQTYIVNKRSRIFHTEDCENAEKISWRNREEVHTTQDTLMQQGYTPAQDCVQ